ncbi:CDP-diacylglycerol--glycerol-3-phosphate 3-phosphatidyltransferase [Alkaliphilus metalliredigens QYMF]|uniref:CDP-diacylglycerol--glycerol-3-phosphate 3-phosphatidyltransferase n=1 Tax=Alkaliphilus metalliredigens (strain QYMF) TaxID=293826 RepID=A6TN32_ALKMQ|nr:CDP-diacylglycerol--glycerol-3-phosphate 3-phosphatidyltransferase [Alkaliphilus metalliredigens]ABR47600.1 CDP-diacylglycerol--glycerol-3-phosphate 3-phosphatidyltransferase [Alkaliphilus metalliredigens QYMF]
MNFPNILTTLRFGLVPLFIVTFFSDSPNNVLHSAYIFIFAGFTDVLDGYIARKYNAITKWGQAMDPLADKAMQLTVLLCFTIRGIIPMWAITIIGIKELLMIGGAAFLYIQKDKIVVPSNSYGKLATILFYVAILAIVFGFSYGRELMMMVIIITAYAFVRYLMEALKQMKANKEKINLN